MKRYTKKRNSTKIFILVTLAVAVVFAAAHFMINKKDDVVIAKINGQKVFKSEIEEKLRDVFDGQSSEIKVPDISTLPEEVLEVLVKEIYLEREITKKAKRSEIANSIQTKRKIENNTNKIMRQAYIDSIIKEEITEQAISDKYAELSNQVVGKKEYAVSHIVLKTKDEAEKVLKELKDKKGAKFADLAKKYSIDQSSASKGGELGYIIEDDLTKEIAEAATTLKKDEVSEPIHSKFGWHIVKITDVKSATMPTFESVKEGIRDQLIQDKINEINSEIIKNASVTIVSKESSKNQEDMEKPQLQDDSTQAPEELNSPSAEQQEVQAKEPVAEDDLLTSKTAETEEKKEVSETKEVKSEVKETKPAAKETKKDTKSDKKSSDKGKKDKKKTNEKNSKQKKS